MDFLTEVNGAAHFDGVALQSLVEQYGTPLYVYSASEIVSRWKSFDHELQGRNHLICYSVKGLLLLLLLLLLQSPLPPRSLPQSSHHTEKMEDLQWRISNGFSQLGFSSSSM